ncbi:MAG TPA: RNA ligase family protein [Polyangiaceae bacterium]|jgi:hypothetical protein|nr:RNA ligase family protein [Polyangiaceae bacterium]
MTVFHAFDKIARLNRECIATEKIDGTNGVVWISEDMRELRAGSRTRWITPTEDNFGFAKWVESHRDDLLTLGPGFHYGEWWGAGINRRYPLAEKRFALFNASRWADARPSCCDVVPELARGLDIREVTERALSRLRENGSVAAPGCMNPEGVVVFHSASGQLFKVTLEKDDAPKGRVA